MVELRPRLRNAVQIHRQHYRGQIWYIIQDPANNQYYRLNPAAYHFVGMLDGQRTVATVWKACNEELGDDAPTQGEAIQLMGQLYSANLIQAELPPDAQSMFSRFQQRKSREVRSYLMNLMFIRLPLFDPDALLNRWVSVCGKIFTPIGGIFWAAMILLATYFLAPNFDKLIEESRATELLASSNLPWLYLSMAAIKALHEFGHAFACKRFGVKNGSGGEVHVMGVMFLVFTPLPYVDASSSWAFASKWQRAVVGFAGMYVELYLAAIAVLVWTHTADGTLAHSLSHNIIFVSGVSTLLFNANPLLRYDGYYMLSDLLEIPNLWQRSREYLYYLVKRYAWGIRRPRNPATSTGEKVWLTVYSIASTIYRFFVVTAILLFVASALPMLGMVLAGAALIAWLFVPLGKFLHYLLVNPELMRTRPRAVGTTLAAATLVALFIGSIKLAGHVRADAIVWPSRQSMIYARQDGYLQDYLPHGTMIHLDAAAPAPVLFRSVNHELELEHQGAVADVGRLQAEISQNQSKGDFAAVSGLTQQLGAAKQQVKMLSDQLSWLVVPAPHEGQWVAAKLDLTHGAYLKRGDPIGMVVDLHDVQVRTIITQKEASRLFDGQCSGVEIRLPGQAGKIYHGCIVSKVPAGQSHLPSPSLAAGGGGDIPVKPDGKGETTEPFFYVSIHVSDCDVPLRAGQKVAIRFTLEQQTLAARWYRAILQVVQTRLKY